MFPECGTRKDKLRGCFHHIEHTVLHMVEKPEKSRLYTYEELASLSGHEPDDWRTDGCIRAMMYGLLGRLWLINEFRLWWKADEENHAGLVFTADTRTGAAWYQDQKTDEVGEAATGLGVVAKRAEEIDPRFRDYFRKIGKCAERIRTAADGLEELRRPDYLRRLGIAPPKTNSGRKRSGE